MADEERGDDAREPVSVRADSRAATLISGEMEALEEAAPKLPRESVESFDSRYDDGRFLGAGGMGEVRLVRDRRVGRDVAMKVMHPERAVSADSTRRFVREARVQGRLEHPSIVPVHDLGVSPEGELYFVMKRIRGLTLAEIVDSLQAGESATRERMSRRRLLGAVAQLCLAMDFAHRHGVLHRDLKPANVMLGDYGELYVLDWGLAKVDGSSDGASEIVRADDKTLPGLTQSGSIVGTPGYAAPEQVRGEVVGLDARVDIYAVGAILFEILAEEPLHDLRKPSTQVLVDTLTGVDGCPSERAPDADIAPELDEICLRATATAREDRFESMRELHDALEAYLEGERDQEVRAQLADAHEAKAMALASAGAQAGRRVADSREAMREVGRALALRPDSPSAMKIMLQLLTEPPAEVPSEVHEEVARASDEKLRKAFRGGVVTYALWLSVMPIVFLLGVREPLTIGAIMALIFASMLICLVGSRRSRVGVGAQYALLFTTNASLLLSTRMLGPLMFVPAFLAVNTFSFALTDNRRRRVVFVAVASCVLIVPFILEAFGWWAPAYAFRDGALWVLPRAVELPAGASAAIFFAGLCVVVVSALWAGMARDELTRAELQAATQRWQLRQLLPEHHHPSEPNVARASQASATPPNTDEPAERRTSRRVKKD